MMVQSNHNKDCQTKYREIAQIDIFILFKLFVDLPTIGKSLSTGSLEAQQDFRTDYESHQQLLFRYSGTLGKVRINSNNKYN
jgi:hypothetical protein